MTISNVDPTSRIDREVVSENARILKFEIATSLRDDVAKDSAGRTVRCMDSRFLRLFVITTEPRDGERSDQMIHSSGNTD